MNSLAALAVLVMLFLVGVQAEGFVSGPSENLHTTQVTVQDKVTPARSFGPQGPASGYHGQGHAVPRGQGPPEGRPFRHGMRESSTTCAREELRRDPADTNLFIAVRRHRLRGYRRLSEKTVLDHEKRHHLYDLIREHPGIDLNVLAELTGLPAPTARYHVDSLVRLRKVVTMEIGGYRRLYENHGRYDVREQVILGHRWQGTGRRLTDVVTMTPGITRGEIAGALGISGPSVTRWLKQYVGLGLFREERDGRYTRYYAVIPVNPIPESAKQPGKVSGTG